MPEEVQRKIQLSSELGFLFEKHRYKVAYGGRDAAKSWGFARALVTKAWTEKLRILCAREIQDSIKDSVHKLLADQIDQLGLSQWFKVTNTSIISHTGSEFMFEGLRHVDVEKIKSFEGIDICWVEEANRVSKRSWQILIPTIRKEGSEIWVSFNPELDTDETYQRFVKHPPPNSVVKKLTYKDNPWLSQVSIDEIEHLKATDPDEYLHVYEGNTRVALHGAIYADELRQASAENRITRVPYNERLPVHTFWDLGFADCTSIWFVQKVGFDYHVIDFLQGQLKKLPYYLSELQQRGYVYGTDYLPHDAEHESLAAPSIKRQMEEVGRKTKIVTRVPKIQLGINATRTIFNRLWFDETNCDEGLQDLRHYRYDINQDGQWSRDPKHDVHSHAADALRTLGESVALPERAPDNTKVELVQWSKGEENVAWMG